jgi:hypothetical protein
MVQNVPDDPGVMGNLPRSRPGRRSEKRAAGGGAKRASGGGGAAKPKAARASSKPKARAAGAKARPGGAKARAAGGRAGAASRGSARPGREQAPPTAVREERVESPQGQDPVTAAIKLGMAVGDAGLKVVARLARRLPRP